MAPRRRQPPRPPAPPSSRPSSARSGSRRRSELERIDREQQEAVAAIRAESPRPRRAPQARDAAAAQEAETVRGRRVVARLRRRQPRAGPMPVESAPSPSAAARAGRRGPSAGRPPAASRPRPPARSSSRCCVAACARSRRSPEGRAVAEQSPPRLAEQPTAVRRGCRRRRGRSRPSDRDAPGGGRGRCCAPPASGASTRGPEQARRPTRRPSWPSPSRPRRGDGGRRPRRARPLPRRSTLGDPATAPGAAASGRPA